jgi:hypothetical protein
MADILCPLGHVKDISLEEAFQMDMRTMQIDVTLTCATCGSKFDPVISSSGAYEEYLDSTTLMEHEFMGPMDFLVKDYMRVDDEDVNSYLPSGWIVSPSG